MLRKMTDKYRRMKCGIKTMYSEINKALSLKCKVYNINSKIIVNNCVEGPMILYNNE